MENNEQNINNVTPQEDKPIQQLKKPMKKRKAPLTVGSIFTFISVPAFIIYLGYLLLTYQSINSGEAGQTFVGALFLLPLAIFIGILVIAFSLVAGINSAFAIRSDIKKVKTWGIVLTVLNFMLIVAAVVLFFVLINVAS